MDRSTRAPAELVAALRAVVGAAHALTDPVTTATYETDWTGRFGAAAAAVVRPADTAQVAQLLAVCRQAGVPVVVQGGNTGLVGGGVPAGGEVLLSTRRLADIGPVERSGGQSLVTVGAGATLASVHDVVRPLGLDVGVDLAARGSATIGGMVATNAGGEHVVRYGSMGDQVAGLAAVLADGSVVGRLTRPPKDNTGYDLERLLTGSEGTLAVITRVRLRLVQGPSGVAVALVAVADIAAALAVLGSVRPVLGDALSAAELMTADGLDLVLAHTGLPAPMPGGHPVLVLLECAGPTGAGGAEALASALAGCPAVRDAVVADEPRRRAQLWRYREDHSDALAAAGRPLKLDVCLPPTGLAAFVEQLPELVAGAAGGVGDAGGPRTVVFGHLAEGNLHVNVLAVPAELVDAVTDAVLRAVAAAGGSISAEHGVGRAKVRWLHLSRSAADLAAMSAVKRALDPSGLLAPGVLLAPSLERRPEHR